MCSEPPLAIPPTIENAEFTTRNHVWDLIPVCECHRPSKYRGCISYGTSLFAQEYGNLKYLDRMHQLYQWPLNLNKELLRLIHENNFDLV